MSTAIRLDPGNGKRGTGAGNGSGTGNGTVATGKAASASGKAGNGAQENPEANRKGSVKAETVSKTGPVIIEGGNERGTETEFEPAPRKRGRPKGSTNRTRKSQKQETLSVDGISFMLVSAHTMLAAMTKNPAWEIADVEAKEMSNAIAKVQEHYPFVVDPKAQAWINLAMVAGMVYVPRVVSTRKPKVQNAKAKPETRETTGAQNPAPENVDPQKKQAQKQGGPVTPSQLFGTLNGRG